MAERTPGELLDARLLMIEQSLHVLSDAVAAIRDRLLKEILAAEAYRDAANRQFADTNAMLSRMIEQLSGAKPPS